MVFGLILLLGGVPQPVAGVVPSSQQVAIVRSVVKASAKSAKAGASSEDPVLTDQPGDFAVSSAPNAPAAPAESSSQPVIGPRNKPLGLPEAPHVALRGSAESPAQRHVWYALAFGGHSAAAFDAWSTRRVISSGAGTEANPLLRPFANSSAIYAATQASPLLMDYLGRRMMHSPRPWVRKMWWLPQTAGMAMSLTAGVHNTRLLK